MKESRNRFRRDRAHGSCRVARIVFTTPGLQPDLAGLSPLFPPEGPIPGNGEGEQGITRNVTHDGTNDGQG